MIKNEKRFLKCVKKYEERQAILRKACDDIVETLKKEFVKKCKELEDEEDLRGTRPDGNYAVQLARSVTVYTDNGAYYCRYFELNEDFVIGDDADSFHYYELDTDEQVDFVNVMLDFINE